MTFQSLRGEFVFFLNGFLSVSGQIVEWGKKIYGKIPLFFLSAALKTHLCCSVLDGVVEWKGTQGTLPPV